MSDDFVRLVSQANPASRYQPANNGYPPSGSNSHGHTDSAQLDPFFDDDEDPPDSAFGSRTQAMQSKESGLPLARNAAAPAGQSQVTLPERDILQDWDEPIADSKGTPFSGSSSFPGTPSSSYKESAPPRKSRWKWKWPWKREEKVLAGERLIVLNNPTANADFCNNYVSTSKYNAVTFLPKFLYGAFKPCLLSKLRLMVLHEQSNSRNMQICSSYSLYVYSKYRTYRQRTSILPLFPSALYSLRPLSRNLRKTW